MAVSISNGALDAACAAVATAILQVGIYTSPRPASASTAPTGTLLATFPVSYDTPVNGVATLSGAPVTATAEASGTAYWARAWDGSGDIAVDGTIGVDFTLDDTNIVAGAGVNLVSSTITVS